MKRKVLIKIITLTLFVLSLSSFASELAKGEIYKIAADFSLAAYPDHEYKYNELKDNGWALQYRSFKKTALEIEEEILNNPEMQMKLMQAQAQTENVEQVSPIINKYLKESGLDKISPDSKYIYLDALYNNNDLDTLELSGERLEQHFSYIIGSKKVNGVNVYVISYKGTSGLSDIWTWIATNFYAWPIEFLNTGVHVHTGFEWYRQACWEDEDVIPNFISQIQNDKEDYVLIITGHSMGGAVAVLQNAFIHEKKLIPSENIHLITLAEPCPGKSNFAERYEKQFKNYEYFVNFCDAVPFAPMLLGYFHFGKGKGFDLGENRNPLDRHSPNLYHQYLYSLQK